MWERHDAYAGIEFRKLDDRSEKAGGKVEHQPDDEGGEGRAKESWPDAEGLAVVDALVIHVTLSDPVFHDPNPIEASAAKARSRGRT